jgi:small GTP-binding protein
MKTFIKKICVCGDPAVGKTSLIRRFTTGQFKAKYITTLGTVISKKVIQFPEANVTMKMQIWDISGQAEFKKIHASAFRHAEAAFVVCDILNPETAKSVDTWISNLHKYSDEKVPVIVLVNKYDLIERKSKNMDKIKSTFENITYPVLTTSAKSGYNVEQGFKILAENLIPFSKKLPTSVEEPLSMPKIFENPYAFLDYVLVRYSNTFGDVEMSTHLIRKQTETSGKDFDKMPKEEAQKIIDKITVIISNFKGKEEGEQLRTELMEAFQRVNW